MNSDQTPDPSAEPRPGSHIADLKGRIDTLQDRCDGIETKLQENTDATKAVQVSTAELVEFFSAMRGAFKVLNWIGKLAKPIGAIVAAVLACVSLYASFREGLK